MWDAFRNTTASTREVVDNLVDAAVAISGRPVSSSGQNQNDSSLRSDRRYVRKLADPDGRVWSVLLDEKQLTAE